MVLKTFYGQRVFPGGGDSLPDLFSTLGATQERPSLCTEGLLLSQKYARGATVDKQQNL
jgi:hypothetical protein